MGGFVVIIELVDIFEQRAQFGADEIFCGHILHGQSQRDNFTHQVLKIGGVAFGSLPVLFDLHAVAVVLPVLC